MAMSKDRVLFVFRDNQKQRDANLNAAVRAFGISRGQAAQIYEMAGSIVCRP